MAITNGKGFSYPFYNNFFKEKQHMQSYSGNINFNNGHGKQNAEVKN